MSPSHLSQPSLFGSSPGRAQPPERVERPTRWWIVVDHTALLAASEREWLLPPGDSFLVWRETLPPDWAEIPGATANRIPVALGVSAERLAIAGDESAGSARCPHAVALHDVVAVRVRSQQDAEKLRAAFGRFANVSPPNADVAVVGATDIESRHAPAPGPVESRPPTDEILERWDRNRGALAMALWSCPTLPPWLDLLIAWFGREAAEKIALLARAVDAPWLVDVPWRTGTAQSTDIQHVLWRAALGVFADSGSQNLRPSEVLDAVVEAAIANDGRHTPEFDAFRRRTLALFEGATPISTDGWRDEPVARAIQLALLRLAPDRFATWREFGPAPAVWLSAAILVGWRCGYPRLPNKFRGTLVTRRVLSTLAMPPELTDLSTIPVGQMRWAHANDEAGCYCGTWQWDSRPLPSRFLWFMLDSSNEPGASDATALARRLGWREAVRTAVELPEGLIKIEGSGSVELDDSQLRAVGTVRLVSDRSFVIREVIDAAKFRHRLATEALAPLPAPSVRVSGGSLLVAEPSAGKFTYTADQNRGELVAGVPGLVYAANFLTADESSQILAELEQAEWRTDLSRRVQHYGWRYDYTRRTIDQSMRLGPLPEWALNVAGRLRRAGLIRHMPDQVIVNEYVGNQGISQHADCEPCFADGIAMVSLIEGWEMIFRPIGGNGKVVKLLEPGSVAVMSGDARYKWTHEIPFRKTENRRPRTRRVSLTFRKVILR